MASTKAADQAFDLKLYYFNIPGKGSCIRLLCEYAGLKLTDHRFKSREEFLEMKRSGKLAFGQVPALEVTERTSGRKKMIFQSAAIMRFLGKIASKRNLYPSDPLKAASVDMIIDQEADAFQGLRVAKYKDRFGFSAATVLTPDVEKRVLSTINAEVIPRHLGFLEKLLRNGGTGWLAGESPTIADFFWYPSFVALQSGWSQDNTILKDFPEIQKFVLRFSKVLEDARKE